MIRQDELYAFVLHVKLQTEGLTRLIAGPVFTQDTS